MNEIVIDSTVKKSPGSKNRTNKVFLRKKAKKAKFLFLQKTRKGFLKSEKRGSKVGLERALGLSS